MARRKKTRSRAAPTAIVVRQAAPVQKRSRARRVGRVIVARVKKRARAASAGAGGRVMKQVVDTGIAAGAGAALAYALQNEKIPTRIAGVETTFALGAALSLVPVLVSGKVGRIAGDVGTAVAAVAAYKLTLGTKLYVKDASGWDGDEGY